ncbi:hypothetical protein RJ55_02121 [Drechmeria coniospora]|nr:hypothetical protein RJ55_02121 [Drechmeria coniospora]
MRRRSGGLPAPATEFAARKNKILQQLAVPDGEYLDASPKGSVDEGIRHLIDEINGADGLVTTSSCAGRVSVFLEGRKTPGDEHERRPREQVAGVGGKGAGGTWLYVSHEPVACADGEALRAWTEALAFAEPSSSSAGGHEPHDGRLIHFKFEPMILHILTASPAHAQMVLRSALQAGFRESGAINLTSTASSAATAAHAAPHASPMPMVAVRCMGLALESLVGFETADGLERRRLVDDAYLRTLLSVANDRFSENAKRIERFRAGLRELLRTAGDPKLNREGHEWEDAAARRERMRTEGLRKKAALAAERRAGPEEGMDG